MKETNMKKEVIALIIVLLLMIIGIILFTLSGSLYTNSFILEHKYVILLSLLGNVVLIFLAHKFLPKNKFTRIIKFILIGPLIPLIVFFTVAKALSPFVSIFIRIVLMFTLQVGLSYLLFVSVFRVIGINLTDEFITFLIMTFTSISTLLFHKNILKLIRLVFSYDSEKKSEKHVTNILEKNITSKNIRFIIYFIFFIFLVIFSYSKIELKNEDLLLNSTFYAFICFIAFDRITLNVNDFQLDILSTLNEMLDFKNTEEEE